MSSLRQVIFGSRTANLHWRNTDIADFTVAEELESYPSSIIDRFSYWVQRQPNHLFIARRDQTTGQWRRLTYAQAWRSIQSLASGLLDKNLSAERPIAILSGNSIEHALLALAAMSVGIPFAPISPQYSLISTDFSKLKYVLNLITPGMVFADNGALYRKAIDACVAEDCEILVSEHLVPGRVCENFSALVKGEPAAGLAAAMASVTSDTIAKFLFSSGSTGMPKAVINTQRMLCANQQMIAQTLPFLTAPSPVLVDWLPWNHTFGGNHNLGIVIYNGGSYYIDDGKPTPAGFAETARNLKEIAPTAYFNVPKGFEELVKAMREDKALAENFFSRVSMLFYAGAGLSQPVWDALEELALATCGERILIVTGLGCTETAPSALFTTGDGGFAGWLGIPMPGVETRLVKIGGKTEIRFRGDNVTPGYWRDPELTRKAFDEDGFYRTGDAVTFVDEKDIQRGLQFDGRISEDFKLDTGTWVSAGPLRAKFLNHFGSCVKDVVIVGRDKAYVSALVFPDLDVCRGLSSGLSVLNDAELCDCPTVKRHFQGLLKQFAETATGGATRICALKLLSTPPSLDKNEITDKGSLNASAVQDVRREDLEGIYEGKGKGDSCLVQLS